MRQLRRIMGPVVGLAVVTLIVGGAAPQAAEAKCANQNASAKRLSDVQARKAIRCLINRQRSGNLKPSKQLKVAAQRHSRRMRDQSCFSHQCPGEPNLTNRVRRTGYMNRARSYRLGEVIADFPRRRSPRKVVKGWMSSPPHRAVLLGNFKHFNVGMAAKKRRVYYTVVFGWRAR